MANTPTLTAAGLYTFQNYLSSIPQGALLTAKNVVIDRDGVIEPSRGFTQYGSIGSVSDRAKQLFDYKNRLLSHYASNITVDNGSGTFTNLLNSYIEAESGIRIKSVELNGNLYITTSGGIKKIATTSSNPFTTTEEDDAGGIKASDLYAVPDYSAVGFLSEYSKVAYRIVWLKRDINDNLIIGYPSPRYEVVNSANRTCKVSVQITTPQDLPDPDIDDTYFFQIYRTNIAQINLPSSTPLDDLALISSSDEMNLIYEAYPAHAEWLAGSVVVSDTISEDYRDGGAALYTNEQSGSGIKSANYWPPFAKDIALYKNTIFFGNTKTFHALSPTLTGTNGMYTYGVTGAGKITYSSGYITITTDTAHSLTSISAGNTANPYFVLQGVAKLTPTHALNTTWQVYDCPTTTSIRIVSTDITAGIDVTLNAAIYTSYITIGQGTSPSERYFFVGRQAKFTAAFNGPNSIADSDYFIIPSMNNEQQYYVWYEVDGSGGVDPNLSGKIGIKVSVTATDIAAPYSGVVTKTRDAILAATYDFEFTNTTTTLTFITPTSGALDYSLINAGATGITFSFTQEGYGEKSSLNYVRLSTYSSPSVALDDTARSLVRVINQSSNLIDATYLSSVNDLPGKMQFEALQFSDTPFSLLASNTTLGSSFSPDIGSIYYSSNEASPNRIYFSKTNEPEHVPQLNYLDIGPKDKAIIRIIGLQDSLFIFKEEGIYRLTGENSYNFSQRLHDSSGIIIAPDSAVVLNNQIYCYTTQGIVAISEAGLSIISRPIENLILKSAQNTYFYNATFGLASETDRALYMFSTSDDSNTATVVYRYNTFSRAWTTMERTALCGVRSSSLDKFFLGANDLNLIEVERKTYNRRDYANRQYTKSFIRNSKVGSTVGISSSANISEGDIIVQTQYLTISQFNRLLLKLDIDPSIKHPSIVDYFSQSAAVTTDDLNNKVEELQIKLLLRDPTGGYAFTPGVDFQTTQTNYNTEIIDKLNASTGVFFTNYQQSTGTVEYELRIDSLNKLTNIVTSSEFTPIISGECIVYNFIPIDVIWAPNTFGDPSLLKHVREATLMFEDTSFTGAMFGFNTDLSANYENITFGMDEDGLFGMEHYDQTTWGGMGISRPFRTYIPRQKQRCRFMRARFQSSSSFTKFAILGLSFTLESTSERAYK